MPCSKNDQARGLLGLRHNSDTFKDAGENLFRPAVPKLPEEGDPFC